MPVRADRPSSGSQTFMSWSISEKMVGGTGVRSCFKFYIFFLAFMCINMVNKSMVTLRKLANDFAVAIRHDAVLLAIKLGYEASKTERFLNQYIANLSSLFEYEKN